MGQIKIDNVWFRDGSGGWAMDEMIEAFLHQDIVLGTGRNTDDWDVDEEFYKEVCADMGMKAPTEDRIVYWCSCYGEIFIWDGPLVQKDALWNGIQERFKSFSRKEGPKVLKKAISEIVKRGLSFGLSRDDLVGLVDEALVEGVMGS